MSALTTNLAAIRAKSPCRDGWATLKKHVGDMADDAPLPLTTILDSNGIDDALWVAYCVIGEPARVALAPFLRECGLRACDHAERALPIFEAKRPGDDRPRKAIEAARGCIAGTKTRQQARAAAADAAYAAAAAAAAYAAYAAADAADAAYAAYADADAYGYAAAARRTAREQERAWQTARLREYLNGTVAQKEAA
ncbi:MAG: hypothetical protein IT518_09005 [Burkholderiales bacterium]|nr:hypothetical protein [Burkholderiales bacterium]